MDDDGFINLRIVRNLLQGAGPVFNVDERVEAGTSPLWLALVALLGKAGARLEYGAVFAGITLTIAGLLLAQDGALQLNGDGAGSLVERLRKAPLPVGAAIFAALPPAWDYASSGLETALGLSWLGASFDLLARWGERSPRRRGLAAASMLVGLGPLIRPEFALYALGFLFVLAKTAVHDADRRSRVTRVAIVAVSAAALPLAVQIFRMGYYASTIPNTGLAKEAFLANWMQGRRYFDNFFVTYRMAACLPAAGVFWIARLSDHSGTRRRRAFELSLALPIAAALHVIYIVRIGGDYMHGRQFVPAVFAALLPVMMVPASMAPLRYERVAYLACTTALAIWVPWCAIRLRIGAENISDIGDERRWYAREAHDKNPVAIDSYRPHMFYADAEKDLQAALAQCPAATADPSKPGGLGCRQVYLHEEEPQISPAPALSPMASTVDPRVGPVLSEGAIGISGYLFPSTVHLVDRHGLADPIVSRFKLVERGRPGHEKRISAAWMMARFAEPSAHDDASVVAARHALHCGELEALERAVTAPLTIRQFVDNVAHAWTFAHLRIPHDPFDAEAAFCGTPPMTGRFAGGTGGTAYRWRCPDGTSMAGLRGEVKPEDKAVSLVQPICAPADSPGERGERISLGPTFGAKSSGSSEVRCPPGEGVAGFYGTSDNLVRSVGLICFKDGASKRAGFFGIEHGNDFAVTCPGAVVGIEGRSAKLVDAVGVVCAADAARLP
jgi:arabinofuranosyltransferase